MNIELRNGDYRGVDDALDPSSRSHITAGMDDPTSSPIVEIAAAKLATAPTNEIISACFG